MKYDENYIRQVRERQEMELVRLQRKSDAYENKMSRMGQRFPKKIAKPKAPKKPFKRHPSPNDWTQEQDIMLQKLWDKKHSARECADMINKHFGTDKSRNAVIGRIHRIRDKKKDPTLRRDNPVKKKEKEPIEHVEVMEKTDKMCRENCCYDLVARGSYCAEHAKIYYTDRKQTEKVDAAAINSGYVIKRYFR